MAVVSAFTIVTFGCLDHVAIATVEQAFPELAVKPVVMGSWGG